MLKYYELKLSRFGFYNESGFFPVPFSIEMHYNNVKIGGCHEVSARPTERGCFVHEEEMMEIRDDRARSYTPGEEIANGITHGFGAALSIAGLVVLVVLASLRGDIRHQVGFSIFGTALLLLYTASTFYHSLSHPSAKKVFKVLDHSAIFLLIAGSYTPFMLISLGGFQGWAVLGIVWGLAVLGIVMKSLFIGRFRKISLALYLGMGWLGVFTARSMRDHIPGISLILILSGGILYTGGVVFYLWRKLPFHHAVWHLFVMAGSTCHYFAVLNTL